MNYYFNLQFLIFHLLFHFVCSSTPAELSLQSLDDLYTNYLMGNETEMPLGKRIELRRRMIGEYLCQLGDEMVEQIMHLLTDRIDKNVERNKKKTEEIEKMAKQILKENMEKSNKLIEEKGKENKEKEKGKKETKKGKEKINEGKKKKKMGKREDIEKKKAKVEAKIDKEIEKLGKILDGIKLEKEETNVKEEEKKQRKRESRGIGESGTESSGMEEGLLMLDFFSDLEKIHEKMKAALGQEESMREEDICHYLTFCKHLKMVLKIADKMPNTGTMENGLKKGWQMLEKWGKCRRDAMCDRIGQIRATWQDDGIQTAEEQKWLLKFDEEIDKLHLQCLHQLISWEVPNSKPKLAELFDMKRLEGENVFAYRLRMIGLASLEEAEQMRRQIYQRLSELVGGEKQKVNELMEILTNRLRGNDMLGLVQFFYTNVLLPSANSVANEAKRHNEIAQINAFALVHRIDAFHWRNGRIANDWAEVRKAVGTLVDELGTEQTGKLTSQVKEEAGDNLEEKKD